MNKAFFPTSSSYASPQIVHDMICRRLEVVKVIGSLAATLIRVSHSSIVVNDTSPSFDYDACISIMCDAIHEALPSLSGVYSNNVLTLFERSFLVSVNGRRTRPEDEDEDHDARQ